jgi:hypothetical protein
MFLKLGLSYRKKINNTHSLDLSYNYYELDDTVNKLNPNYFYTNNSNNISLEINYQFKNDYRDSKAYPLKGYYFDINFSKKGLGILKNEKLNLLDIETNIRKYLQLNNKFYFAAGSTTKLSSNGFHPYRIEKALGYVRNFVRGYEYYVIDGQNFELVKTNFKYELISRKVNKIDFIKTEKFNTFYYVVYLNAFVDMGYVKSNDYDISNTLVNSFLCGYGIGLDYVTYYDKVLRLEFSINKLGEKGLFLHFMAPI